MKLRNIIWKLVKGLLKLAFKIFIILLWGSLRLIEVFLQHFNIFLKKLIT
jgi:hypothetical protein